MTRAEAITILETMKNGTTYGSHVCDALDMSIKALEKQTAKKPIKITRNGHSTEIIIRYDCPTCRRDVTGSGFHCWNCGQALDWIATIREGQSNDES